MKVSIQLETPRFQSADPLDIYRQRFYSYGVYGVLDEWIVRGFKETPAQMAKMAAG